MTLVDLSVADRNYHQTKYHAIRLELFQRVGYRKHLHRILWIRNTRTGSPHLWRFDMYFLWSFYLQGSKPSTSLIQLGGRILGHRPSMQSCRRPYMLHMIFHTGSSDHRYSRNNPFHTLHSQNSCCTICNYHYTWYTYPLLGTKCMVRHTCMIRLQ